MTDNKDLVKEFILKNPNLSGNASYKETKDLGFSIRKSEHFKIYRESKNLPEPSLAKKEASIPIKYRTAEQKVRVKKRAVQKKLPLPPKPPKIPFEQTKFGKIVKTIMDKHGLSEQDAIERARALLKIPKDDFDLLDQIDQDILIQYGY